MKGMCRGHMEAEGLRGAQQEVMSEKRSLGPCGPL